MKLSDEYCIVVVLYKMDVEECPSVQSLLQCTEYLQRSRVILWDNSPVGVPAEKQAWLKKQFSLFSYTHTPSNLSLSSIYNQVCSENKGFGYLILLDQDSRFGTDYFKQLNKAKQSHPKIDLFAPAIYHNSKLVSPGLYYAFKGKFRSSIQSGVHSTQNMCIITSGICISFQYLHSNFTGFDERLRVYNIDTFFSLQFRKHRSEFFVFHCAFEHSLSQYEEEEFAARMRRFADYRTSLLILTQNYPLHIKLLGKLYLFYEALRLRMKNVWHVGVVAKQEKL
jgi:hypothetical protein